MYEIADDPYGYPGTTVLKNRLDIRSADDLEQFEHAMASQRAEEPLPRGRLGLAHFRAVHRHLFGDVYEWAGKTRRVRLQKGESVFCYPENIDAQLAGLFNHLKSKYYLRGLSRADFARAAASFLSTLNAIRAFREGNGRTQLLFLALIARSAGHPLRLERLQPEEFLDAMVAGFGGDEGSLFDELARMIA